MILTKTSKIILSVVIILIIAQIFVSSKLSAIGENVSNLDNNRSKLLEENQMLEQKIASASALSTVQEQAVNLGFIPGKNTIFLDDSFYVVQR